MNYKVSGLTNWNVAVALYCEREDAEGWEKKSKGLVLNSFKLRFLVDI